MKNFYKLKNQLKNPSIIEGRIIILLCIIIFTLQSAFAQQTLIWTGEVDDNALNPSNWNPPANIAGNILKVIKYPYNYYPVIRNSSDLTINRWDLYSQASLTIEAQNNARVIFGYGSNNFYHYGILIISSGTFYYDYNRNFYIERDTSKIIVKGTGTFHMNRGTFVMGRGDGSSGGYIYVKENGTFRFPTSVIRFCSDTSKGSVITITDNGVVLWPGNNYNLVENTLKPQGNFKTTPDREIVVRYDADNNITKIYSRDKMGLYLYPETKQLAIANTPGPVIRVEHNPGWENIKSFSWKYSTTPGGPYTNTLTGQNGDTCAPIFPAQGIYYLVCVGINNDNQEVVSSNEVKFLVSSDKVFIEPTIKQKIKLNQKANTLVVKETGNVTSREWKYSTDDGMTFNSFTPAFTDNSFNFPVKQFAVGKYIITCQSVIDGITHISNPVEIEIVDSTSVFDITWTGIYSSDVKDMRNWYPSAHITQNNLIIPAKTPYSPELSSAGNDVISGLDIKVGAYFTLNKPSINDTLFRNNDVYLNGNLIIKSGVLRVSRLRMENDSASLIMTGGKLINYTDWIVGGNNTSVGAKYIILSGNAEVDAGSQIWRFSTDTAESRIYLSENAKIYVNGNWLSNAKSLIESRRIRGGEAYEAVADTVRLNDVLKTIIKARKLFDIVPLTKQIILKGTLGNQLSTIADEDRHVVEWLYSNTIDGEYKSFTPAIKDRQYIPKFDEPGYYYIKCKGERYDTNYIKNTIITCDTTYNGQDTLISCDTTYTIDTIVNINVLYSRVVPILNVSLTIAPKDSQKIVIGEVGNPLTVTELPIVANGRKWYKKANKPGAQFIDQNISSTTYIPMAADTGYYTIICKSTWEGVTFTSNEVIVRFYDPTAIKENLTNDLMIYPNPVKDGRLYINTGKANLISISLYDLQGRNLMVRQFNNFNGIQELTIKEKGIFILKVITTEGVVTSRLIIE